jgi:hypothetical protein
MDLSFLRLLAKNSHFDSAVALSGESDNGLSIRLALGRLDYPLILYSIDYRCNSCLANIPFLNDLSRLRPCGAQVEGVLLSAVSDTAPTGAPRPDFRLIRNSSGAALTVLPLATPSSAVLLGKGGRYVGYWRGVLDSSAQEAIQDSVERMCL